MPTDVLMPHLGEAASESTLLQWLVHEGDAISKGQPLCEVESDKVTVVIDAAMNGTVARLLVAPNDLVAVGRPIARILSPGEDPRTALEESVGVSEQPVVLTALGDSQSFARKPGRKRVSPLARCLARRAGIDASILRGTGPGGRIIAIDVRDAIASTSASSTLPAPQPDSLPDTVVTLGAMRGTIARRMLESSRATARVTLATEVDAEPLVALRTALQRDDGEQGKAISYDVLLVVIAARALQEFPEMNASIGDGGIEQHAHINVGVAVDTSRGLMVPVLKHVPSKDLLDLAAELRELIARARAGRLTTADSTGGTFTVTNLGHFGVDAFTPIINLPECAILGVGRIVEKPVVRNGHVVAGRTITLSLSFDHRIVDGAVSARFLQRIGRLCETPALLR